ARRWQAPRGQRARGGAGRRRRMNSARRRPRAACAQPSSRRRPDQVLGLKAADLEMDLIGRRLTREGRPIELGSCEFDIRTHIHTVCGVGTSALRKERRSLMKTTCTLLMMILAVVMARSVAAEEPDAELIGKIT